MFVAEFKNPNALYYAGSMQFVALTLCEYIHSKLDTKHFLESLSEKYRRDFLALTFRGTRYVTN